MKPLLIYVAGPLSAPDHCDMILNVVEACKSGKAILDLGHVPFIPHLSETFNNYIEGVTYEQLMAWDFEILARCDAILFLAPSPGANRELARAEEMGLIIYRSIEEIPYLTETNRIA